MPRDCPTEGTELRALCEAGIASGHAFSKNVGREMGLSSGNSGNPLVLGTLNVKEKIKKTVYCARTVSAEN